jgi:PKD repeat protein
MVDTSVFDGHWRIGGDAIDGLPGDAIQGLQLPGLPEWPNASENSYLAGSIADVAVYPSALSASTVLAHYNGGAVGASAPIAKFTSTCTAESCAFDASTSTDTGGTIATYSWNFGDGSPVVTGASPTTTHVYPAAKTYSVTLTIVDNTTSTNAVSHTVSPNLGTGNPVAAFTSNCTGLSCAFDASGSTDTGGTITTYSWNFGDGSSVVTGASPTVTHVYAASSFSTVTLTVTDDTTSISTSTSFVSPTPSTPLAAFTSTCTGLSCSFNGSTSGDTGATITSYKWNFGDGSPVVTSASPTTTHVYASAGSGYSVTLTVTDSASSTDAISHNVTPTGPPPPSTPVAAFTSNCTALSCVFTDTSTDTGSTITGWSWNFGDGSPVSTDQNPTHVYASGATYNVSLMVTDNLADTNTTNASVSPTSGVVTLFASDTFNRTVAGGLGAADLGGAWTRVGGVAGNLSVAPGAASFLMPSPSVQDSVYLGSVSQTTTDTDTTFTDNNTSTGTAGVYVYVDGRRVSTNNEYDARIRLTPTGGVAVELTKYAGSATATAITSEVTLPSVTFTPGTLINVRFQVSGTSPTTLKVKVWPSISAQPAAWTLTATDTSAGLQLAGAVGLTTYLSGSTTNAPTTVKFTSFSAGPLQP